MYEVYIYKCIYKQARIQVLANSLKIQPDLEEELRLVVKHGEELLTDLDGVGLPQPVLRHVVRVCCHLLGQHHTVKKCVPQ